MFIARWSIEARFGHKAEVLDQMHSWMREIGAQVGWTEANTRLLTGSIGVKESTIQTELTVATLAELEAAWAKLATLDSHAAWSKQLEPHVVSGTQHWEIFRLLS